MELALPGQHHASLNLTADVDAQGSASVSVKSEHKHLLASFPQIDDFSDRRIDLRVGRPATALKRAVELAQVPASVGQILHGLRQLFLLVFPGIAILPCEPECLV